MRFRSPENQDLVTTQELVVLQLATDGLDTRAVQRVLVPLPSSYEELMAVTNETFGLSANASVHFFTQELAGNRSYNVEITKTVWDAVKNILTSVIVEVKPTVPEARKTPRKSIAPPLPDRVVTHDAGAVPTKEVLDAARRLSRMSIAPGDRQRRASRRSFAPRASLVPPTPGVDNTGAPRGGDVFREDDDEEVVLHVNRGASKRQVIASEDEEDEQDEERFDDDDDDSEGEDMIDDEAIEDDLQTEPEEQEEETGENIGEDSFLSAKESRAEREPSPAQPLPKTPASKAARRTSEQRSNVSQVAPSPNVKTERESPSAKSNIKQETPVKASSHAAPPRTQTQPEDRFVIVIEYDDDDGEENETKFMTRGRHTVAKVLKHACRTFDLDDYYDSATLVLALELEEDGEIVEHRFVCPKEETMAQVGAEAGSRFIVHIEDD